jgi:translation initiation factor 2B subunit (eIF-2B alpha/beta/delta family)
MGRSLEEMLRERNPEYDNWVQRVKETVADQLFPPDRSEHLFFLPHGLNHFRQVETNLMQLLAEDVWREFTDEELLVLLCSVWLHDAGMSPTLSKGKTVLQSREVHHITSAEYVLEGTPFPEELKRRTGFYETLKAAVAITSKAHRRSVNMEEVPLTISFPTSRVRLQLIASLLRVADGIDITNARVDRALLQVYGQIGMPRENWIHWVKHMMRAAVFCDYAGRRIDLDVHLPRLTRREEQRHGPAIRYLVEELKREIEAEVFSVARLVESAGLKFYTMVRANTSTFEFQEQDKLDVINAAQWSAMMSAVNASGMEHVFLESLKAKCEECRSRLDGKKGVRKEVLAEESERCRGEIEAILREVVEPRKHHFGLQNLQQELQEGILTQASKSGLSVDLLQKMISWCDSKETELGRKRDMLLNKAKGVFKRNDCLVLYSYSATVIEALGRIPAHDRETMSLIVLESRVKDRQGYNEGLRILQECCDMGFQDVAFTLDATVPSLIAAHPHTKIVLGADGYTAQGVYNTAGVLSLAYLAQSLKSCKLYVLTTTEKGRQALSPEDDLKIRNKRRDLANYGFSPTQRDIFDDHEATFAAPVVDLIPKDLINGALVTEERVYETGDWPFLSE